MDNRKNWPAWGRLIDDARDALRPAVSQNEAAKSAGITGTHWRSVVKGEAGPMTSKRGVKTIARMADVSRVTADQLAEVGRADVAKELQHLDSHEDPVEDPRMAQMQRDITELREWNRSMKARIAQLEARISERRSAAEEADEEPPRRRRHG